MLESSTEIGVGDSLLDPHCRNNVVFFGLLALFEFTFDFRVSILLPSVGHFRDKLDDSLVRFSYLVCIFFISI